MDTNLMSVLISFRLPSLVFYLSILFIIGCLNGNEPERNTSSYYVDKISDGDTFWVHSDEGEKIKIRLIGIDAPESSNYFKKRQGYYGKEAKSYLTDLLASNKLKLEFDIDREDQYRRTLAYAYLEDGTFINAELIKNGCAVLMTVPPNVKYADLFLRLQQEARDSCRGLWGIDPN